MEFIVDNVSRFRISDIIDYKSRSCRGNIVLCLCVKVLYSYCEIIVYLIDTSISTVSLDYNSFPYSRNIGYKHSRCPSEIFNPFKFCLVIRVSNSFYAYWIILVIIEGLDNVTTNTSTSTVRLSVSVHRSRKLKHSPRRSKEILDNIV